MRKPTDWPAALARETPDATIKRLQGECDRLRWERDRLAAQSAGAQDLWSQLVETAAECDNLRAEVARLLAERATKPGKVQTDQLAWITMSIGSCIPIESPNAVSS